RQISPWRDWSALPQHGPMTELCCSHSIGERIHRAQLLLCRKLRVSPILHPTSGAQIPGNQASARLTLARLPKRYQAGPTAGLPPAETKGNCRFPPALPLPAATPFRSDELSCQRRSVVKIPGSLTAVLTLILICLGWSARAGGEEEKRVTFCSDIAPILQ